MGINAADMSVCPWALMFAEKGDLSFLGVRTIEGFSVMVDNIGHRLVAQASYAA